MKRALAVLLPLAAVLPPDPARTGADGQAPVVTGDTAMKALSACRQLAGMLAVAAVAACGGMPDPYLRQHPEFANRSASIATIAVVPAVSDFSVRTKDHFERVDEQSTRIRDDIGRLLVDQLSSRGYEVQSINESQVYADEVAHLVTSIRKSLGPQSRAATAATEYRYSLDSDIRPIAETAPADLIVLAGFSGWKRTGGSVAAEYAVKMLTMSPADPTGYASMLIALVDARTGDVLWTNIREELSTNPNPPDFQESRLQQMLTDALAPLVLDRRQQVSSTE